MALGFGFNKAKVMAAADKFVQQGKLQNAINEYEKVIKEDPTDLTVLNTTGDLWWRLGKVDQAVIYFKRVGDAYAMQGFLVKAIAMYKKLAKLNPTSTENTLKLAELYAQQGLNNDARAQYMLVADSLLRNRDNSGAAEIFKTMLKLDPTNVATQSKLADLYIKLGKKDDAKAIYFNAAQTLYEREFKEAAIEALRKGLQIDPENVDGLILRGKIAADAGDPAGAVGYYESIPGLDANVWGLRALLAAKLQMLNWVEAEPVALKLLEGHHDVAGLSTLVDKMMEAGEADAALRVYDNYTNAFLTENKEAFRNNLEHAIGKVKSNPRSLERLRSLFEKIGDTTQSNELSELLAHAYVEQGQLEQARDLYKELSQSEPQNPLHYQNYKQVLGKLGEDVSARTLTPQEAEQAFMADEMSPEAAPVEAAPVADSNDPVHAALTESELFSSYNLPAKAVAALEAVLPSDPGNAQLNTELAALYYRVGRFADAARCCEALTYIYNENGNPKKAQHFEELAKKYERQAGIQSDAQDKAEAQAAAAQPPPSAAVPLQPPLAAVPEFDIGSEWDTMVSIEASAVPPSAPVAASEAPALKPLAGPPPAITEEVADAMDEARFYIAQSMWPQALSAIDQLDALVPGSGTVADLRARANDGLKAMQTAAAEKIPTAEEMTPASASLGFEEFGVQPEAAPPRQYPVPNAVVGSIYENAKPVTPLPPGLGLLASPPAAPAPAAAAAAPANAAPPAPAAAGFDFGLDDALGEDFDLKSSDLKSSKEAMVAQAAAAVPPQPSPPPPVSPVAMPGATQDATPAPPAPAPARTESSALGSIFDDFKEEMEVHDQGNEDPETHYSLGIAFKEMGLLDEAIGELQTVCRAIENGTPFAQAVSAYTWLGQCLVEKGAAQAAIPWYEKALQVGGIDQQTKLAISYDLASANEAAGDAPAARKIFMQVYGSNIDYRDVAERLKSLKP